MTSTLWCHDVEFCFECYIGLKNDAPKVCQAGSESSDDNEGSSKNSKEEGLECPICWESFNIVVNVPYVLWCGHTLCKNCVLGLQWAVVKFPALPLQLPLFVSCPWCHMLSFWWIYKGNLMFPRKKFFLLLMVESMNGDRVNSRSTLSGDHQSAWPSLNRTQVNHSNFRRNPCIRNQEQVGHNPDRSSFRVNFLNVESIHASFCKSLAFFLHLTAKFPLVVIFLLIVVYAIPACAAILVLYIVITLVFAVPSFLILYFAYPCLDWLVREITS